MRGFSSINQFRNVVRNVRGWAEATGNPVPTLTFHGTVKLHGSNGGIGRGETGYYGQSKSRKCQPGKGDNFGIAGLVERVPDELLDQLFQTVIDQFHGGVDPGKRLTIFGELIGKGVQKGTAISGLDRQFVIFQTCVGEGDTAVYTGNHPDLRLPEFGIYNILEVPTYELKVDIAAPEDAMKEMERLTYEVEAECPWGKKFDISGVGEGIVWTCVERPDDKDLWFKTKGPKHAASKTKTVVQVDPEKVKSIREWVDTHLTEYRLNQGLDYLQREGHDISRKSTGTYLKFVLSDLQREEGDSAEASELEWKDVNKAASQKAREFFFKAADAI